MKKTILLTYTLCIALSSFAQSKRDCSGKACTDPGTNHSDPYNNNHLCENFNPLQIDFSGEYFDLRKTYYKNPNVREIGQYDLSPVFLSGEWVLNGVLGLENQRIQIHINKAAKKNDSTYIIYGKSKVKLNVTSFKGELRIVKSNLYKNFKNESAGSFIASYLLKEDSTSLHSGKFNGFMECMFYIDGKTNTAKIEKQFNDFGSHWNISFVGVWTDNKTKKSLKCIWGDNTLPFTFDFDCGQYGVKACDKYIKNGWEAYNYRSEISVHANGDSELKDKWWKKK
jgi:hypothetical protein